MEECKKEKKERKKEKGRGIMRVLNRGLEILCVMIIERLMYTIAKKRPSKSLILSYK